MTLKDLLKKRNKANEQQPLGDLPVPPRATVQEFTFVRSDTNTQEILSLSSSSSDPPANGPSASTSAKNESSPSKRRSRLRSSSNASITSRDSRRERRLSSLLNLRSHSNESRKSSANVPADLPQIDDVHEDNEKEAKWEERATILAKGNPNLKSETMLDDHRTVPKTTEYSLHNREAGEGETNVTKQISDARGDVYAGRLEMWSCLADTKNRTTFRKR